MWPTFVPADFNIRLCCRLPERKIFVQGSAFFLLAAGLSPLQRPTDPPLLPAGKPDRGGGGEPTTLPGDDDQAKFYRLKRQSQCFRALLTPVPSYRTVFGHPNELFDYRRRRRLGDRSQGMP